MTKVMTFGTFDILHPGHLNYFEQARKHGDEIVVVISRDVNVKKVKGEETFFKEQERLAIVQALRLIDRAILGNTDDVYQVVNDEKPDVICLGYDQFHFIDKLEEKLKEFGLNSKIVRLESYMPEKYKISKIKEKLAKSP